MPLNVPLGASRTPTRSAPQTSAKVWTRKLPAQVLAIANLLVQSDVDWGPKDDVAHG
jgi:hypothetical protein